MKEKVITYKISSNKALRVYTVREYINGISFLKYRSYPVSKEEYVPADNWTQQEIKKFVRKKCYIVTQRRKVV